MPGKVVDVLVNEGDIIGVGKTLIILDAMKMENILKSETKVRVLKILLKKMRQFRLTKSYKTYKLSKNT